MNRFVDFNSEDENRNARLWNRFSRSNIIDKKFVQNSEKCGNSHKNFGAKKALKTVKRRLGD
ncbi:hypothetical protein B1J93_01935 [Leptospira kirschneri serovar Pomona]|uniref:Uncharacterized protein n=1 Tax=Leptospira kirschneri serovar Pomona TaxID=561005 RepID=A0A1T1E253_9LEPT|nr:hypothetical protein APS47_03685 [Leptospira kirschneri serovar Mozdok]KXZ24993.1 hypothetical protein AYB32_04335 [Leptospira kirschneri]KXZ33323.1 hypothetical protein AYB34_00410 [Leptospira sp. ZV016]OOV47135.1 hypothetical protein B1J93_01935 [Leptospira kirschneri serovar Pomona]OOV49870.1 hypothetical protein B1J94_04145 [Leptospira kirschneri serovar Grippotyphosa]